ncbi:OLC1v1018336C1 [Oldenlandia corymbosa var. corymbosa]|uniref:OLC1v1018336C1 n=1 Tax=Oldenlandia corymbosa var. corymbosa TaxID=529605 RepID=A0AAV1EBQ1_OLDCO|nr:OLC1v1018336C1 [Oldenlandia corymbosa var. corymbosa]
MVLDLRDFLLRAKVLKLYRQALRTVRRAPIDARGDSQQLKFSIDYGFTEHIRAELRGIIRQEIENNRNCHDKQKIRFFMSDGLQRLKVLDETLDMQGRC